MARPIEPTPVLEGSDAEKLLTELAEVCSPDEARQRIDYARSARAEMMRPKHGASGTEPRRY